MPLNYVEGDWFAIPLEGGGYGAGLIARMQPRRTGVLLGFFFGPKRDRVPTIEELRHLHAGDAVMVRLFGHLDIRRELWPIIGRSPDWTRSEWPVPVFVRRPSLGPPKLVTRADDDPNFIVNAVVARNEYELVGAVPEGLLGSALAAKFLAKKLSES